jgi:hypothetical protein
MIRNLAVLIEQAVDWPRDAQEQLVEAGREIAAARGGVYDATSDELAAIDEANAAGTASEEEVRMVLGKFRQA